MKRKIQLFAGFTVVLLIALIVFLRQSNESRDEVVAKPAPTTAPSPAPEADTTAPVTPPRVSSGRVATAPPDKEDLQQVPPHPLAASFGENPELAMDEPALLLQILLFYRMEFGDFPAGQENRDIMNALTGNNPKKLPIFPGKHPRIDRSGNLLDAWGNPFVFHPVSNQYLEVRSYGPDGEIHTDDDIVVPRQRDGGGGPSDDPANE